MATLRGRVVLCAKKKCGNAPEKLAIINSTSKSFLNQYLRKYSLSLHYKRKQEKVWKSIPTPSRPTTLLLGEQKLFNAN